MWDDAALSLCGGRWTAHYFFDSSESFLLTAWAERALALLAVEVLFGQALAVCPMPPQNMHKLLSKRRCLSCGVNFPSLPNLSESGLAEDLGFSLLLVLLLLPELEAGAFWLLLLLLLDGLLEGLLLLGFLSALLLLELLWLGVLSVVERDFSRVRSQ